ncbi:hypothetical protein [Martelella sp. HB161492]|uniref:hypothetical protein n=1 Tax=Martelella sp. HB161492 TaxID=2720726 RepID=UPI0015929A5A|nr:hypothetical protein [Martelella sp. HB161492]
MAEEKKHSGEAEMAQLDQKDLESASGAGFFGDVEAGLEGAWEGAADSVVGYSEVLYHSVKEFGIGVAAAADYVAGDKSGAANKVADIKNDFNNNLMNDWLPYPVPGSSESS